MTKARSLSDFIESDGSVTLVDNQKIKVGTSNDLEIYHDGFNNYIDTDKGSLLIRNTLDDYHVIIQSDNGSGGLADYFRAKGDTGQVILYHYGNEKLATTSTGIDVTGTATMDGLTVEGNVLLGAASASTGSLYLFNSSNDTRMGILNTGSEFKFQSTYLTSAGYKPITFEAGGSTRLYLDSTGVLALGSVTHAIGNMSGLFRTLDGTGGDRTVAHFGAHNYGDTGKTYINIGTEYGDGTSRIGSFNDTTNSSVLVFETHATASGAFNEAMRVTSDGRLQFSQRAFTDTNNSIAAHTNNYLYVEGGSSGLILADNAANSNRILVRDANNIEFQTGGTQRLVLADTYTAFNDTGADCDFIVESASNTHAIYVNAGTNSIHFGTTGNFGGSRVNVEHPTDCIGINLGPNASGQRFLLYFNYNGSTIGSIKGESTGVTYNTTSDIRLKTDIEPIKDSTEKLMSMNPVEHKWKADQDADSVHGFIAQEMEKIVPEAVSGDPEGEEMMSMDYGRITPIIVGALQDAHNKIIELENKLKELGDK